MRTHSRGGALQGYRMDHLYIGARGAPSRKRTQPHYMGDSHDSLDPVHNQLDKRFDGRHGITVVNGRDVLDIGPEPRTHEPI